MSDIKEIKRIDYNIIIYKDTSLNDYKCLKIGDYSLKIKNWCTLKVTIWSENFKEVSFASYTKWLISDSIWSNILVFNIMNYYFTFHFKRL